MQRKNLPLWIAALSLAGIGWLLTLAAWGCELDPWGLASAIVPDCVSLGWAVMVLRHGCQACTCAALILLATGLIEEVGEQPSPRMCRSRRAERDASGEPAHHKPECRD